MYYVYVLRNQDISTRSLYIGFSENLKRRLAEHLDGRGGQTTSRKKNWKLIYYEAYLLKEDALGREKFLKSESGRRYMYKQLVHYFNKGLD